MVEPRVRFAREVFLTGFFGAASLPDGWAVDRITSQLIERRIGEGEPLFREGDLPDRLYFVDGGSVRSASSLGASWRYEGRWLLGMGDVLLDRPRSRTAIALRPLDVVTVEADDWLELFEESSSLARTAVRNATAGTARLYVAHPDIPLRPPNPTTPLPDAPLSRVESLLAFFQTAVLRGAGVQTLAELADASREIRLAAGEVLAERGRSREDVYLVAHGTLACDWAARAPAAFGRGNIVGGAAFFGDAARAWEAKAEQPASVLAVPVEAWFDAMEEHFELARCALGFISLERERIFSELAGRATDELVLR